MKLTYTKSSGETLSIESPYESDAHAAQALHAALHTKKVGGGFPQEILNTYNMVASGKWKFFSEAKRYWLHALTMEKPAPKPAEGTFMMDGLRALFAKARKHLKRPSIKLEYAGKPVKISIAGGSSRYPNQIMVAHPDFGAGFYGRVDDKGCFYPGPQCDEGIKVMLSKLSASPAEVAAEYGRLSGCCCFCNRKLDDEKSTSVGYGPVCAERFGLPWGAKRALISK